MRGGWLGGVTLGLAATTGLVVGMNGVVAVEVGGLARSIRLPAIPRETLEIAWSARAIWPADLQEAGLERLAALITALFLAAASVALLNVLVLLFEAGTARWRETVVRAALGAGPWTLSRALLRDVRTLVASGLGLGVLLGLTTGAVLRLTWPGPTEAFAALPVAAILVPTLALLTAASASAYAGVGLATASRGALTSALSSGARVTAHRRAVFLRRALSVVQTGTAGAVSMGAVVLAAAAGEAPVARGIGGSPAGADTAGRTPDRPPAVMVVTATRPAGSGGWSDALDALAAVPGIEAESLAAPGTLVGLGIRDHVTTQCGNCFRGGLPMPLWGATADHHVVGPDYFRAVDLGVVDGRGFDRGDGPGSPPVAVVNRTFAGSAFENGDPVGRRIRVGTRHDAWYEVVGVVDDAPTVVVGGAERTREVVYLSALQHPPRTAHVLVRGDDDAVATAAAVLAAAGFATGTPRSLAYHRRSAAAPLAWIGRVAAALALLTLALALAGARATALQVTRRRQDELAVRRMVGASDPRIVGYVLVGAARTGGWAGAWALFLGTLGVALIRKTAAGVPALGPGSLGLVAALLVGAFVLTALAAAREALRVEAGATLPRR